MGDGEGYTLERYKRDERGRMAWPSHLPDGHHLRPRECVVLVGHHGEAGRHLDLPEEQLAPPIKRLVGRVARVGSPMELKVQLPLPASDRDANRDIWAGSGLRQ